MVLAPLQIQNLAASTPDAPESGPFVNRSQLTQPGSQQSELSQPGSETSQIKA